MPDPTFSALDDIITQNKIEKGRGRIEDMITAMRSPDFDFSKITPEDYVVLQQYYPQIANYVEEVAPQQIKAMSEGAVTGRQAQMEALDRYRQLGRTGDDVESRIMRQRALDEAASQNRAQQGAIQESFARRGMGGSGNELVSALLTQQGAAQRGSSNAQQAALDSYQRRLDALRSGSQLGSQIRGEDVDLEGRNVGILNDYNQRFAANRNKYNQYAADLANKGQMYNIEQNQSAADRNVEGRNKASSDYQNRYNDLQQQSFNNDWLLKQARIENERQKIEDQAKARATRQSHAQQSENTGGKVISSIYGGMG